MSFITISTVGMGVEGLHTISTLRSAENDTRNSDHKLSSKTVQPPPLSRSDEGLCVEHIASLVQLRLRDEVRNNIADL